jgi:glycosyltransferase involved in cell wall biosynthesis
MEKPLISVIMPVYNASKYLSEAINSILNQTYDSFELIILNDNSTDDSLKIIKKHQELDKRILVIDKEKNVGPAKLRNEGFDIAKGEYIALMDADDISLPRRFEKQLDLFIKKPEIGVCGTWFELFGENIETQIIKHYEFHNTLKIEFLIDNYIGNPTVMIRSSILNNHRFKNEFVPMEDYDLWSKLICETQFYNIQEVLVNYRWHETNISHTKKVNLEQIHKTIRNNQLLEFELNKNHIENEFYFESISFSGRKKPDDVLKIINAGEYLINKNRILKKFDTRLFESKIKKVLSKNIEKSTYYNLNFFRKIEKTEYFKNLKWSKRAKITIKSYWNWYK